MRAARTLDGANLKREKKIEGSKDMVSSLCTVLFPFFKCRDSQLELEVRSVRMTFKISNKINIYLHIKLK